MSYDVFSYGMISTSKLVLLENDFPKPDCYSEIKKIFKMTGGEAANSSIVLSKLGIRVKLDGNWLGNNSEELNTIKILNDFEIDTTRVKIKDDYKGPYELVCADNETRTIFGTYGALFSSGVRWNKAKEEDIINSKIVCLDPFFKDESKNIAELCIKNQKPYVSVDCRYDNIIAKNAEVLIISGEFRGHQYNGVDKKELFESYMKECKGLVIFTSGKDEIIYSRNNNINTMKPFEVEVIDTAGAGDSFRSGIIFGLLNGWSDKRTIRFAAALSALVCNSFPGVLEAPTLKEVEELINMEN
jgi:sugar/nucleoside kinase (ribokinase family)